ncbi:MAG: hypothetical protein PHQ74_08920 [Crocinitomicaceae bacterium]|nr:hypothetical protein [Crocinitomicaceae bacterium]
MKYILIILTAILSSCSSYTDISFRTDRKDEFIRGDGFMIQCRKDGKYLIVGTYTPESWGTDFYYGYLKGKQSERKLKITSLELFFLETDDTLTLQEIRKERDYFYTSPNLQKIIDSNKKLKIRVHLKNLITEQNEIEEFILTRKKYTYSTGTFPHS